MQSKVLPSQTHPTIGGRVRARGVFLFSETRGVFHVLSCGLIEGLLNKVLNTGRKRHSLLLFIPSNLHSPNTYYASSARAEYAPRKVLSKVGEDRAHSFICSTSSQTILPTTWFVHYHAAPQICSTLNLHQTVPDLFLIHMHKDSVRQYTISPPC